MFCEEKVHPSGCSPRASCYLEQGAGGSCLEVALVLIWLVPGSFCRNVLKWSALRKSFGDVRFFEEKVHSLSVAPEPLAIWNKKLEGLDPLRLFENLCSEVVPET